jgi:hypothetical protein
MSIHHQRHQSRRARQRSAAMLFVSVLMVLVLFAGALIAYYFIPNPSLLFARQAGETSRVTIEVVIAETPLIIPERYVARVDRQLFGSAQRVDLILPWPFDPKLEGTLPASTAPDNTIVLTLRPLTSGKLPDDRLAEIYPVYVESKAKAEGDLTRHTFRPDSPYADSELYVDETARPPLVIRCDLKPPAIGPLLCNRQAKLTSAIELRVRFAKHELADWRRIWTATESLAQSLIRKEK